MIASEVSSISYSGNASIVTPYALPFPFRANEDIAVIVTDVSDVATTLVYGTDYSVSNAKDSEGRITSGELLTVASYPSTSTVAIRRVTPKLQETDLVAGGNISREALESSLDQQVMMLQETYRDATGTNVAGIVAEGRTISPAALSGMAIADGDGVAGNPTISNDSSGLSTVTSVADADKVRVEVAGVLKLITAANLTGRTWPHYRYVDVPIEKFVVAGGASGISLATGYVQWTSSATGTADARITIPEDYDSGEISLKINAFLFGGTPADTFVMKVYSYLFDGEAIGALAHTSSSFILAHSATDCRSEDMGIGDGLVAGSSYLVQIERESAHASDDGSDNARMYSCRMQYSSTRVTASWS